MNPRIFVHCLGCLILVAGTTMPQHRHGTGLKSSARCTSATSCNPAAQKHFDRAVALLHSFEFTQAIDGFNAALKADSSCGVAYWGIALSQWSNPFAAGLQAGSQLEAGRRAAERGLALDAKTEREASYVKAVSKLYADFEKTPQQVRLLAYRDAMADMAARYPQAQRPQSFMHWRSQLQGSRRTKPTPAG